MEGCCLKTQIHFKEIVKQFPTDGGGVFRALDCISIKVGYNEFFTLLGPSGCGKTTLLRILAGFEMPNSGCVLLDDKDITSQPANKRSVNTVFQSYALFPHMTIQENIGFGVRMLGAPKAEYDAIALEMLDLVKLPDMASRKPSQLSGGQQQRVALARALAPKPRVLLLDEPLSALDLKLRKEMQIEMKRIQRESNTTFIFVTHDQEEALTMSDRIAVMDHGTVQQIGTPHDIYNNPTNRFVADFIGEMNLINTSTYTEVDGSTLIYDTPLGKLYVNKHQSDLPNKGDTLAIRPERFLLFDDKKMIEQENVINGFVENIIFTGPFVSIHVRSKTQNKALRVRLSAAENDLAYLKIGKQISLVMPRNNIKVLSS